MADLVDLIAEQLRAADRDRYFASLIVPPDRRPAIQALYAFNAEVAQIAGRVSEPMPGEIRLQWWRDALEGRGHGNVAQTPVAEAFLHILSDYNLQSGPFVRLVAARRFDLYQDPMPDLDTFEGYAGETVSVLYQSAAMILNDGAPLPGDAAGHLGVAHALIGHLRAFGFYAAQGRLFLPKSAFEAHGVTEGEILAGQKSEGLTAAFDYLVSVAEDHLGRFRTALRDTDPALRSAFAPVTILEAWLKLVKQNKQVFAAPGDLSDWQKIWRLFWWNLRNGR